MIKRHYYWVICIFCLLLHFCTCGLTTIGFSVYTPHIQEVLGFSNTQTSLIPTMRSLSSMIMMPVVGFYYKKLTLRQGITVSCVILAAAYLIFSYARVPVLFYAGAVLMGMAYSFGSIVPISLLLRNWFETWRSTVLGAAVCGSSLCTVVIPYVVNFLMANGGMSTGFIVEAAGILIFAVIACLVLRNKPQELGMKPYDRPDHNKQVREAQKNTNSLTKANFILFMAAMFLVGGVGSPSAVHLSIHYTTAGYSALMAAAALSVYGGMLAFGKFFYGFLTDRFGAYRMNFLFFGIWIVSNILTGALNGSANILLFLSSVMVGLGIPLGSVGIVAWTSDLSDEKNYSRNLYISQTAFSVGALAVSLVPGIIADYTGNYSMAYVMFGIMITIVFVIVQAIYHKSFKGGV